MTRLTLTIAITLVAGLAAPALAPAAGAPHWRTVGRYHHPANRTTGSPAAWITYRATSRTSDGLVRSLRRYFIRTDYQPPRLVRVRSPVTHRSYRLRWHGEHIARGTVHWLYTGGAGIAIRIAIT